MAFKTKKVTKDVKQRRGDIDNDIDKRGFGIEEMQRKQPNDSTIIN